MSEENILSCIKKKIKIYTLTMFGGQAYLKTCNRNMVQVIRTYSTAAESSFSKLKSSLEVIDELYQNLLDAN
jgi:hypothetical protein